MNTLQDDLTAALKSENIALKTELEELQMELSDAKKESLNQASLLSIKDQE